METTAPPPPPPQNELGKTILAESQRIIISQPCRFLALSFLFLLLPSAAATAFLIIFQFPVLNHAVLDDILPSITKVFAPKIHDQQDHHDHTPSWPAEALLLAFCLFVFNLVFSSCGVGTITYAVFHGFQGQRPKVNLKSAISSLAASFFPLLATTLLLQAIAIAIVIAIAIIALTAALLLGFGITIDVYSPHFLVFANLTLLALMLVVTYVQADWSLALAITSVEPTNWGFESLRLSKALMNSMKEKGARERAFSMSYISGVTRVSVLLILWYSSLYTGLNQSATSVDEYWSCLSFTLAIEILMISFQLSLFQLILIAMNTLLYALCKASNTEQHGREFSAKYVIVPVDDEKVVLDQRLTSVV